MATGDEVSDRDALELVLRVTRAVSEQSHLDGALTACLREICVFTGWKLGEVWMPNADRRALRLVQIRTARDAANDEGLRAFIAASERLELSPGVGLVGRVFATGEREWVRDVETLSVSTYLRVEQARAAGLHAALGVPVRSDHEVLAVMVFYLDRARTEDPRRVELVSLLAAQVGLLIRQQYAKGLIERLETEALSTPVLTIWEGIALVPLVGALDPRRAQHLQENTLSFLERCRAKAVLIDVTGIPEMDTHAVNTLIELAKSTRLLGTRAILTGVSPGTARTLVKLGVSFDDLSAESTLADGLRSAIAHVERPVIERATARS